MIKLLKEYFSLRPDGRGGTSYGNIGKPTSPHKKSNSAFPYNDPDPLEDDEFLEDETMLDDEESHLLYNKFVNRTQSAGQAQHIDKQYPGDRSSLAGAALRMHERHKTRFPVDVAMAPKPLALSNDNDTRADNTHVIRPGRKSGSTAFASARSVMYDPESEEPVYRLKDLAKKYLDDDDVDFFPE